MRNRLRRGFCVALLLLTGAAATRSTRHEFTEVHLGVPVRIVLYATDAQDARAAARAAFTQIAMLDATLSDYRPDSELRRLEERPAEWVPVSPALFSVLERAIAMARFTDGAFDPTAGALTRRWRDARTAGQRPDADDLRRACAHVGWSLIALDTAQHAVRLARSGVQLDLGGIGKGFALQHGLAQLRARGVPRALIEAGGDIVVGDAPPDALGWRIDGTETAGAWTPLTNVAVATSGSRAQHLDIGPVRYSHVIDPRTGEALTTTDQVTVIADDASTADALATAASVLGREAAAAITAAIPGVHELRWSPSRSVAPVDTAAVLEVLATAALAWMDDRGVAVSGVAFTPTPEQEPWISALARVIERRAPTRVATPVAQLTPRLTVRATAQDSTSITFELSVRRCATSGRFTSFADGRILRAIVVNGQWQADPAPQIQRFHGDGFCAIPPDIDPAQPDPGAPAPLPGYTLVWHDEFDGDGPPSPASWIYETGFVRNRELQWYQPQNVTQAGGLLVISGQRERVVNPQFDSVAASDDWKRARPVAEYSSGSIKTMGKHAWTFGRFEMRGRIDIRRGMWPAFWTVGSGAPGAPARAWPANGEIDILEFFNGVLLGNAAWASERPGVALWDDVKIPIDSIARRAGYPGAAAWAADFHVWRMDWDRAWIRHYVDDRLLNEIPIATLRNRTPDGANPFHEPHHLILNLAIGATGGDPSATPFPVRFEVDWVRVHQRTAPAAPR